MAVDRSAVEEAIALGAKHLSLSRAEFLEALGPRVVDQMIAAAATGVASGRLSIAAAEEAVALIVSYLNPPPRRFSRPAPDDRPTPHLPGELLDELERLVAEYGVPLAELVLFLRESAEMRIAEALTVLRLLDQVENLARGRTSGIPAASPRFDQEATATAATGGTAPTSVSAVSTLADGSRQAPVSPARRSQG